MPQIDWSIVVPVRDEAGNVGPLAGEIAQAMTDLGHYELIFVDDGSVDGTGRELSDISAADSRIRIITHRRSCGQSQAVISGVTAARSEWVVTLDGDGQNDPSDIVKLVSTWGQRAATRDQTLFIGRRTTREDGDAKAFASAIARYARQIVLADDTQDSGCGLKLIRRELFLSLPRFDALHRFVPALVRRAGGTVESVDITHRPRLHGHSKYGVIKRGIIGVIDLLGVFWLVHRHTRPAPDVARPQ